MYQEYDEITLKKLQQTELNILKDFIYICETYNLEYFSFAGTAIGALRHQGFIPWDDDIDVCLPRESFDKFLEAADREFPDKYTIMNFERDENYPLTTTRWMIKGTKFREYPLKDVECELGIFLDIYPFDNVADEERAYRKQAWDAWFYSKLLILRTIPKPVLAFKGIKAQMVHGICGVVSFFLKVLGFSGQRLYEKCKSAMCRYQGIKTRRISFLCDTNRFWNTISRDDLYPLRELNFEDIKVKFPKSVEKLTAQMHPDFMTLPPEEKRKNHYPYQLDFGEKNDEIYK